MADLTNDTTSTSFYQIKFTVRGHVMKPDGSTIAGITVKAFDKDIDQEKVVGTTVSGTNGLYIINFTSQDLSRPDKAYPDLIVRGYDPEGNLVAASPLITGVTSAEQVVILRIGTIESPEPPGQEPPVGEKCFVVMGKVHLYNGPPFKNGVVRAFHETGGGAIRLGEDATDGEGQYTISYEIPPGVTSINLRVTVTDEENRLLKSSEVIYKAKSLEVVNLTVPATIQPVAQHRLEGRIVFDYGLPAEQIALRLYSHGFGGTETMLGETVTGKYGLYALPFDAGSQTAGLEVCAVDAAGEEVPLSRPLYNLSGGERTILNIAAPASLRPLAAEYQRLANDLESHIGQMSQLANAIENADQQDLTFLNRATGWDARLIALAANAAKLSGNQGVGLSQEVLYGLFRTGLPSDKLQLARVSVEAVGQALARAREAGIIELSDDQVAEVRNQFETFACEMRLSMPLPGSRSTYNDMLKATGLSDDASNKFASVYLSHRGDAAQMWEKAAAAGITHNDIQILQTQGKLSFLTCNSAAMTTRLQHDLRISDPVQLVDHDFYRVDKWEAEVRALAGNSEQDLEALIPLAYEGATVEDRMNAYAGDMARKVRLSYPTQVIGRMVETDAADDFRLGSSRPAVAMLLKNAAVEGFKLGQMSIEPFLQAHPGVLNNIDTNTVEDAKQGVKTLQRVYQITPSNEAMLTLLSLGFTSAYDVVAIPYVTFLDRYGHLFPSPEQAGRVYRKAEQVNMVTYNLFTIAQKLDSEVPVNVISAPVEVREAVKNELIKQFPTMESLFGSIDFCECKHCRSVLSPAAYLVDLLQFLGAEDLVWQNFLNNWKNKYNGQEYTTKYKKPYEALIERRPDLPHIPLTCENTHTALPYIDVVNEILEYYVANDKLDDKAAHDTGNATTPELLAEPQNVVVEAYTKLKEAHYPLILPFDLWLETVRRFADYFETPLWRILEAFRPGNELFVPAQTYDRAAIFAEQLGLSPAEYAIFTDSSPLDKWYQLYGYETAADATTVATDAETGQRIDLHSAKSLSRRLGVTYKELVEIVKTGFVNPQLDALVILYKLGVTISDVLFYRDYKGLLTQDPNTLSQDDLQRLNEVKAFERRLDDMSRTFQAAGFDARDWLNTALQNNAFDGILVLSDPDAGCNFDQTTLRYASGLAADDTAFLKINLFVRLWRKLGWSIEETDRALRAFVPKNAPFEKAHLSKQPLKTALIYLAHLNALDKQLNIGKQSRLKLITLWSQMATIGKNPLYAQLFLTRSVLKSDPVFDDPLGNYLSPASLAAMAQSQWHEVSLQNVAPADKIDRGAFSEEPRIKLNYDAIQQVQHLAYQGVLTNAEKARLSTLSPSPVLPALLNAVQEVSMDQEKAREFTLIKGHMPALQGALGLTADEIGRILTDAGKSIDDAELSLAYVSLLYRYGLLAKALKLSVRDLIALKQLSGIDPFKPLSSDPITNLAEDYPFSQTLHFVEVAKQVKESGFKIEDLDYLLRHRFDPTGKYRPDSEASLRLMKILAEGVRAIRAEHAVPEDAGAMDEDTLRQKLGLVLPPDVVERFLSMMNGTAEFTATKTKVLPADQLDPKAFADELSIRQVTYNATYQEQKLTFRGVLFDAQKALLKAKFPSTVFSDLLDDVQTQARTFFERHLQKQAPDFQPASGFLEAADFDLLFVPIPDDFNETQQQDRVREQRTRLAQAFLPFLQQRLIRQFIIQTMTAHTGADPALVEALLTDAPLLGDPRPLLEAFTATEERGLTATFFASADGTGPELVTLVFTTADTALKDKDGNPLKPVGANSARFEGYLEVTMPGAYRFYVVFGKKNAEAELRFHHMPEPFLSGVAASDGAEISEYLELKPGVPYRFTLQIRKLGGGEASLLVQGETLPKNSLARLTLYPQTAIERADHAQILLCKALQLIQDLNLKESEVRYLLTHAADFGGLNLSNLPVRASDDTPDGAKALFTQFLRLAGYARLKRDLSGGTDDLIGIFEAKPLDTVYTLIARLTRREEATVRVAAESMFAAPDFSNELAIQRLWEVLQIVERFGVPVASITGWTRIVNAAATQSQGFAIARDLKQAIKARFEPETWQRIAQPIFDKLRQRQRDALVAHVMHQHGFARMEQLYEYFLIDPGMEPVVQTSRIRLAISSVQLFIQRCLLNLEKHVHPSVINAKQWEWMKRYRVWEANRKIFLFPENWLEPEFRDDKTHLFSELEGNLLQGDVSKDLVEDAFLNYLKKLEELAQLEIVAMYCDEKADDPALNTLHVIGRTYNTPHKYFYRRYAHQMWTPWEPVTAEIEGDHLAPVIWRDRLYLFWVTFMDKPDENAKPGNKTGTTTLAATKLSDVMSDVKQAGMNKNIDVQLHWSEYLQGEWSTRQSSGFIPLTEVVNVPYNPYLQFFQFNSQPTFQSNSQLTFNYFLQPLHTISTIVPLSVPLNFDLRQVFIHVSKKYESGEERGVYIHLGGAANQSFYLAGRNSLPEVASYSPAPAMPYSHSGVRATRYSGAGPLTVTFARRITTEDGKEPVIANETQSILREGKRYTLLPFNNAITLGTPEIASLVSPFFYQDNTEHTFFVEPSLTEKTIEKWQEWVTYIPEPKLELGESVWLYDMLRPMIPEVELPMPIDPIDPIWNIPIDDRSIFQVYPKQDWLVNQATVLQFGGELIGPGGLAGLVVMPTVEASSTLAAGGMQVNVHTGSELAPGNTIVVTAGNALEKAGLAQAAGGMNVVGSSGFNSALAQNFESFNRSGFGPGNFGNGLI